MTYLLDTHVLVWASTTPERLGPAAVEHLPDVHRDPGDRLTGYGDVVRLVG